MESIAHSNYVRYAPRKVNQVLTLVRRKKVSEALKILRFLPKKASLLVAKTIKSAASNAGDRELKNPNLQVQEAWVGQGPVLKRMRAYAMGRGSTYKRKTCHLTVVVSDNGNGKERK
ncbi:MAG: 50S ribosomal protein L22 [Elusimicrobia bacterium]|nr:50S ribosomal protein L22 [Elusimicrobiota bacterium]MBI2915610.1 50S ribosomal protein L22 [Elusimicrobiota bacterium]MBI3012350.1 50S ribosomal protein L22 [Elusimicrobiota bacterium]MBI4217549.1 50S ribosomal protein L22 [Elusimicrobiota bacterium]